MTQSDLSSRLSLKKNGFTFKHFFVAHDRCAMKVGTDAILLGAWAPVAQAKRVLDIGTGSGLIALMLAQRTSESVMLDAIELDPAAARQAEENVLASPWANRIQVHAQNVVTWAEDCDKRYSLIVSNPPYFVPGVECATPERATARYTGTLDHQTLLRCAEMLIEDAGFFCVVLPEAVGHEFIALAQADGWHLRFRTDVAEYAHRLPHRVLLGFSPLAGETLLDRMAIRGSDKNYSDVWCSLTRDFYLFL